MNLIWKECVHPCIFLLVLGEKKANEFPAHNNGSTPTPYPQKAVTLKENPCYFLCFHTQPRIFNNTSSPSLPWIKYGAC